MKKYLFSLAVAALCGLPTASAVDADHVRVTFKSKGSELKVEAINTPVPGVDLFNTKRGGDASQTWHYVRVPLTVEGKAKGADKGPNFVDELKVHVYMVFAAGKGETPIMLDKEITYVEIPLQGGKSDINAGVFISPANASKILGDPSKIDFSNKLAAVAVEASFKGASCINTEVEPAVVLSHELNSKLNGAWWKKNANNKTGAVLNAISETPFAPFYGTLFPATKPLYGDADGAGSSAPTGGDSTLPSTPSTDYTPSSATGSDDSSTDAAEDGASAGKKGKKNKKSKNK